MIGLGGIGSWLVRPVCHLLKPDILNLWDGDVGETKNLSRQAIGVGVDKATYAATIARASGFVAVPNPTMVDEENVATAISGDVVLVAPDNHACRRLCLEAAVEKTGRFIMVVAGNEEWEGNVMCYASLPKTAKGRKLVRTPHPFDYHPDLMQDKDDGLSCAERLALGDTQNLPTNYMVGAAMLLSLSHAMALAPIPEMFVATGGSAIGIRACRR